MDKIKTVKIKNPDGSVSEETYTISVDAKDVDMKNGKDLQDTIGDIDVDRDGNIAEQLGRYKDYSSDIETLYADVDSLEAADTDLENDIIDLQVNKINKTDIIDNLNSSSNTKVLSAKQGKVLGDAVTALDTDIKKKAYFFDTVAAMKAANLKDGDYVCTLGYYSANDGGAAEYKIVDGNYTDDGGSYHQLNNELFAELIIKEFITPEQFGAKTDVVYDNSLIFSKLSKIKRKIICALEKTYYINNDINIDDLIIDINNSTIKSNNQNGNQIVTSNASLNINIINGIFDNVCIVDTINNNSNHFYKKCEFKNTNLYGIQIAGSNELFVEDCYFNRIGIGNIDITYQGCGIRTDGVINVKIENSKFEYCHGTGAVVIRNSKYFYIYNNVFDKNDYRGIALSGKTILPKGLIVNNLIMNNGVYASHNTGVGCNGIYGNGIGAAPDVTIRGNRILNVCENAIEGAFGLVEYNYVDGTGVDQTNHPTPSASGINMYGGIYRNNIIKNSYLPGLYVSGNMESDSMEISNKKIYNNTIEECVSMPNVAIFINATTYNDIDIYNNTMYGSITMAQNGIYNNCIIGNNQNIKGEPYTNGNAGVCLIDKGNINVNGFNINGSSISNISLARATATIQSDGVLFTATGTNGVVSFVTDCKKNAINYLKLMINDNTTTDLKCTVQGTKDDDTTATIAYQRPLKVSNHIAGIFIENDNTYKKMTYQVIFGDTGTTMLLKNFQIQDITY